MRAIILAAGQGTRLKPFTDNIPKCMVKLANKPLLQWQLDTLRSVGIIDIAIVAGYRAQAIDFQDVTYFYNSDYMFTNMVVSLFCASEWLDGSDDILICYGDIVYEPRVVQAILTEADAPMAVAVDSNWYEYWITRMKDPLSDAETLKINTDRHIYEIGRKTNNFDDIQGQYMGLIRVKAESVMSLRNIWESITKTATRENWQKMYMTDFIQALIKAQWIIGPIFIAGGWLEVDTISDLELYEEMIARGTIGKFISLFN